MKRLLPALLLAIGAIASADAPTGVVDIQGQVTILRAGHPSLQKWLIPAEIPAPASNRQTPGRAALGRALFHDPLISLHGRTSCASCHDSARGFADGVPGSVRFMGERMNRNSPPTINLAYLRDLMWDGRNVEKDGLGALEHQAIGSQAVTGSTSAGAKEAGMDIKDPQVINAGVERIKSIAKYREAFDREYPGEVINQQTIAKALAAYQRGVRSANSPFDRWVQGDAKAMSEPQIAGFAVFVDAKKGNCVACHSGPLFSDGSFHNIGVADAESDVGRFKQKPVAINKGAFRTAPLREVENTAPYFHDGSANTLRDVVELYRKGGKVRTNLSPLMKPLDNVTDADAANLVAFLQALTSPREVYERFDRPQLLR